MEEIGLRFVYVSVHKLFVIIYIIIILRSLSEEILEKLETDELDIQSCRGQDFDNGSNMAGKYEGVQAHIYKKNDLAKFVPCAAHSLNLVGVHAVEVSVLMVIFFGKVYFFSSSPLRWKALLESLKTTLKRHCDTRWSSRRQAMTRSFTKNG